MRLITAILLLAITPTSWAELQLVGRWTINQEETQAVTEPYDEGSGLSGTNSTPYVVVMGVPVPTSRSRGQAMSSLPSKDPKVLRCSTMEIDEQSGKIRLSYSDLGNETLRQGHYRGRDSKWDKTSIEQQYKTTERKVTKTWSMRKDGRLLVEVKIKPNGDKTRTFRRVFDRTKTLDETEVQQ